MSHDSFLFLDTPISRAALIDHIIQACGLKLDDGWLKTSDLNVDVRVWKEDDRNLSHIEFGPATLTIKFMPRSSREGSAAQTRVLASILQTCPGDASFEFTEGGVELLRRGDRVYLDPDGVSAEELANNGYRPFHIAIGLPEGARGAVS